VQNVDQDYHHSRPSQHRSNLHYLLQEGNLNNRLKQAMKHFHRLPAFRHKVGGLHLDLLV
jgi:hypothetical protein